VVDTIGEVVVTGMVDVDTAGEELVMAVVVEIGWLDVIAVVVEGIPGVVL
jgi:hypothetical protein